MCAGAPGFVRVRHAVQEGLQQRLWQLPADRIVESFVQADEHLPLNASAKGDEGLSLGLAGWISPAQGMQRQYSCAADYGGKNDGERKKSMSDVHRLFGYFYLTQ